MKTSFQGKSGAVEVTVTKDGDKWRATVDGREYLLEVSQGDNDAIVMQTQDQRRVPAYVVRAGDFHVWLGGRTHRIATAGGRARGAVSTDGALEAPMPGTILKISVQVGDTVAKNQVLLVVEAMKMEHAIRSPRAGTVSRVFFNEGDRVGQGDVLVELE